MGNKTFKILAIDGGGIRGLYSASILNCFEKQYGSIIDYFDLIAGTSTGGLLALALGAGKNTGTIVDFYKNDGPKIFPSRNTFIRLSRSLRHIFFSSKYSDVFLKQSLQKIFSDKIIDDAKCCLCIPAVNLSTYEGIVFKTSHHQSLNRDRNIKMIDIALATSAAPTYFPVAQVPGVSSKLVDGGLWANNPSLLAVIEALTYIMKDKKEFDSISILSIGNLSNDDGWPAKKRRKASVLSWRDKLITLTMNS